MPIVEPTGESDRQREARIALAKKALHLRAISRRTDGNGFISPEDALAAAREAGVAPPPAAETEIKLTQLRAALHAGLSTEQAEQLKGTTPDAIAREIAAMQAGDGGARTHGQPVPDTTRLENLRQQVAEAERSGDASQISTAKGELLQALTENQ